MKLDTPQSTFSEALVAAGWLEARPNVEYSKGDYSIVFDTSSWMELSTIMGRRVFDVAVPEQHLLAWTLNLIDHLIRTDEAIAQANQTSV